MERKVKKFNYKLRGRKDIEDKIVSKESTPPKLVVPRAQSTPVECEEVSKSASESETDEDEDLSFCFTQDTLEVQWDYSNTPKGKDKKKHLKTKRKSKGDKFAKNKRRQEFSPIEALKFRKRVVKEEPKADLTKLIAGLQALAEKVKEEQGIHKSTVQKDLPSESCSTRRNIEDHLNGDVQILKGSRIVRKQLLPPNSSKSELKGEVIAEAVNENYTSLFNDDDDDCMVRCSQEVEQNLNEPDLVDSATKEELSSDSVKNSKLNENKPENHLNNAVKEKESLKTGEDDLFIDISLEKGCNISDTQKLRESCVLPSVPHSDLEKNVHRRINESFTALFEDDADDCMVLCSQEIEEKLNDKQIDNVPERMSSNAGLKKPNTAINNSGRKKQTSFNRTKSDSAILTTSTSNVGFDDSLDMLLQHITEEDIYNMTQGVPVKKNMNLLTTNSSKHQFQNHENGLKSSSIAKISVNCRMPLTNRRVHQTNYKQSKSISSGNVANKLGALTFSKTQCKIDNVACANVSGAKLNRNTPVVNTTICGSMENKLNINSTTQCSTYTGTNKKTEISNSLPKTSPQKCTPEEIEKKRIEARKKLEIKKLSMIQENGKCSHPSKRP